MERRGGALPGLGMLVIVALLAAGSFMVLQAGAANQGEVEISTSKATGSWEGASFTGGVPDRAACAGDALCDSIKLKVTGIDDAYWDTHKGGVEVQISPKTESRSDFDVFVDDKDGNEVAKATSAGSADEQLIIPKASAGKGPYKITIMPYAGALDASYTGGVRLESRETAATEDVPTEPVSGRPCVNGAAAGFPCKGVDLEGYLPLKNLDLKGDPAGGNLNDIWGWTDSNTGKEYALVGKTNGTAFVDVSDPRSPRFLGELPGHAKGPDGEPLETIFNTWRDVKVYKDHAYVVSEEPTHGMQVFDLTRLRGVSTPRTFTEDGHYSYLLDGPASVATLPDPERGGLFTADNAHNIAINEESGVAYAIGTSTCGGGGSHMIDIKNPKDPKFIGCDATDSYTHDNQCVNYKGPDADHVGEEICFNSNEDTVTVTKVAEKNGTRTATILDRESYPDATYTHQGWLTPDARRFLVNDELDEQEAEGVEKTQTYIWDVENLDDIKPPVVHKGVTGSIDHNMYTKGERLYQSNYRSGLRILDTSQAASGALSEKGFFDVYPDDDEAEFNGTWSNYPYFKSGIVVVSGIEQGLFVLRPDEGVGAAGNAASPGKVGSSNRASGVPARGATARKLRIGFGGRLYGRARKGRFAVQCRQSSATRRRCLVVASRFAKGKRRTVGSGSALIGRSGRVTVKLTRYGRALLRKRPKGTAITLQARAKDGTALVVGNKRARLRR